MADFNGKVVFITGGSRGLGLALATRLVTEGASVTLLARDADELARAAARLGGERVLTIAGDATDTVALDMAVETCVARFGRLDLVVHNAGEISVGPFESFTDADFESALALHLGALLSLVRLSRPLLAASRGSFAVISSVGGRVGLPHMTPYSASKFAQAGLTDGLRAELALDGISMTVAYPGLMRTGSPENALVGGQREKEFAWFAVADHLPLVSMSADRAARVILRAVAARRAEIVVGWSAKVLVLARALAPETLASVFNLVDRLLPSASGDSVAPGVGVRSLFDRLPWFPGREAAARAEWNQR